MGTGTGIKLIPRRKEEEGIRVIGTDDLAASLINAGKLQPALQNYTVDIDFTSVDQDDITWTAGSIELADGRIQKIDAGSLTLTGTHHLYATWGSTSLSTSDTAGFDYEFPFRFDDVSYAVGDDRFLVAVAKIGSNATESAFVMTPAHDSLVINSAFISDCSITKLTAGNLSVAGTITSGGKFITGSAGSARIEITNALIAGYNSSNVAQFYLQASDGLAYAGAGNVILDANGITVKGERLLIKSDAGVTTASLYYAEAPLSESRLFSWNSNQLHVHSAAALLVSATNGSGIVIHAGDDTPTVPTGENLDLKADDDINITPGTGAYRAIVTRLDTSDPTPIGSAIDTEYQNTNAFPLFLVVTINMADAEGAELRIGSASPPTTSVCNVYDGSGGQIISPLSSIVPVGWYYKVVTTAGTPAISDWEEIGIGD